jgi:hypothetical protein
VQAKIIEDAAELPEQAEQDELQRHNPEQGQRSLGEEIAFHILIRRGEDGPAGEAHLVT